MKNFVVGYTSFFDNELELHPVVANDYIQAMQLFIMQKYGYSSMSMSMFDTEEEIKNYMFDCDAAISAIEV